MAGRWTWRIRETWNLPFLRINLSRSGLSFSPHLWRFLTWSSRTGDLTVNPPGPGPTFVRRGKRRRRTR